MITIDTKNSNLLEYKNILQTLTDVKPNILVREVNYNQSNLFLWSLIFYIISLIVIYPFYFQKAYLKILNLYLFL